MLEGVCFNLNADEDHVLAGENGAGKSTLIKVLADLHTEDEGTIELAGRPVRFATPREANCQGISVMHQEMPASTSPRNHAGNLSRRFVEFNVCSGISIHAPAKFGEARLKKAALLQSLTTV